MNNNYAENDMVQITMAWLWSAYFPIYTDTPTLARDFLHGESCLFLVLCKILLVPINWHWKIGA